MYTVYILYAQKVRYTTIPNCRIVFDDAARLHVVKRESVFEEEALQRDDLSVAAAKNIKLEPVSLKVQGDPSA